MICLTEREEQLLQLLRKNPFMSQMELANELNISRPLLANIISTLVREGKILGRAYVLPNEKEIVCIGGANMDRKLFLKSELVLGTSNPTSSNYSIGGVARNIAENLGRLNHHVTLLTACGKDADWQVIENHSQKYMNVSHCKSVQGVNTGSYSAIINPDNELVFTCTNMDVYEHLDSDYILKKQNLLLSAQLVIIDLNCPKKTIEFTQEFCINHHIPFIIVPVSLSKMNHLPDTLQAVEWFICNKEQAEFVYTKEITTENHYEQALDKMLDLGAKRAVISAGTKGIYFKSTTDEFRFYSAKVIHRIKDIIGAGDAFTSGIIHHWLLKKSIDDCIMAGLVNGLKTLQSKETVRFDLTDKLLLQEIKDYKEMNYSF